MLAWKDFINLDIVISNDNIINVLLCSDDLPPCLVSFVYCHSSCQRQDSVWNFLHITKSQFEGPWVAMGDFNTILQQVERSGGKSIVSFSKNKLLQLINEFGLYWPILYLD